MKHLLWPLFMCLAGTAHAAVRWCDLLPLFPVNGVSFETAAADLNRFGCTADTVRSAHSLSWSCTDQQQGDTNLILVRETEGSRAGTVALVVGSPSLRSLDPFASCPDYRLSSPSFVPGSAVVADTRTVTRSYRRSRLYLLRLGRVGYVTAGSDYGDNSQLALVQAGLFGSTPENYPSTRVEIAGENLVQSTASRIISALEQRGARLVADERNAGGHAVRLTAPVGLPGVTEIEIELVNQHAWEVKYRIGLQPDYETYVSALNARYGPSSAVNATGTDRGCRRRNWESGRISIMGYLCPNRPSEIRFVNFVVNDQITAWSRRADRAPVSATTPVPRIDPDNL